MNSQVNLPSGTVVKVNDQITLLRMAERGNKATGQYKHLYFIQETGQQFYSTKSDPTEAFEKYCHTTQKMILNGITVCRMGTTRAQQRNHSTKIHIHHFMIEETREKFSSEDCNIYKSLMTYRMGKVSKYLNPQHEDMDWE